MNRIKEVDVVGILNEFFPYMGKKDRRNEAAYKIVELFLQPLSDEELREKVHERVSGGCRLCDYWDAENYHCMLNVPIHPAYPCHITDQILTLLRLKIEEAFNEGVEKNKE